MNESFSYPQSAYNTILKELQRRFGLDNSSLPKHIWIAWRKRIKELFEENFTVAEILSALDESSNKKLWPSGDKFWKRMADVCRKNRRENKSTHVNRGMESMDSLLERVINAQKP